MPRRHRLAVLSSTAAAATLASFAWGQVDNPVTVVTAANTVGSVPIPSPLGAFGYDPVNDRIYVAGFSNGDQKMRRIDNVSGVQTITDLVAATGWLRYGQDDTAGATGGSPTPGSVLLNPQAIGALPAYSQAWVFDAATAVTTGTGTTAIRYPERTKKIYTYNLQLSNQPIATDVFTTQMTLAQFQTAAGQPVTSTSSNLGRQPAWSGDGQSLYFNDTSTQFGGMWKIAATGGAPVRLLNVNDILTEPAVITSAGVDTIYFRGGPNSLSGGTLVDNTSGIDKITHDGTNTTAREAVKTVAQLRDFMETTGAVDSQSMSADAAGNLYFNVITTARRGIYKLDTQGRLIKVIGYEERRAAFNAGGSGNPNSNTLRMQPRTVSVGAGSAAFNVTQILYAEPNASNYAGANQIAGAYVFKPGDFDRDNNNDFDADDINAFKAALTLRGVPALSGTVLADQPKLKFDLNGNNEVSFKDVKVLQSFLGFFNGDADINRSVDIDDFGVLAANFNLTGKKWTEGDFNGDEAVNIDDFGLLASNFNQIAGPVSPRGAAVPEPAGALAVVAAMSLARRPRKN